MEVECSNPECKKSFRKQSGHTLYCCHSCAAHITNSRRARNKLCPKCGTTFRGERKYCSLVCVPKTQPKYTREQLISKIENFYLINKRPPVKTEFNSHWQAYKRVFKKWNHAITAAGFTPNKEKFTHRFTASDGHVCDSLAEKIIDDWLSAHSIKHECHNFYPDQKKFRVDFLVNSRHWIEFVGLKGELKRYDDLYKQKKILAKNHKIKIIELFPHDLFPKNHLSVRLAFLLK
ncbi:MAG: hypothetical protein AAB909_03250 [Patescibacteria group bacterium]